MSTTIMSPCECDIVTSDDHIIRLAEAGMSLKAEGRLTHSTHIRLEWNRIQLRNGGTLWTKHTDLAMDDMTGHAFFHHSNPS